MIIKKVNIIAFGGIKDKQINFTKGFNLIYGENEAGKSTIQSFIKIWLYGFSNYKGKDYRNNERLKYMPISGENISGELYVEFENKEYAIRRTFGKSKKDDTSIIVDAVSGEEVNYISKEEPGKYFFNINRSTFMKTIFISQLGVSVRQDKEEELLNKISASIGAENGEVSINAAFSKLDNHKKNISNVRKNGKLDVLNDKYVQLVEEKYEAYKLSKHNLDNEDMLIRLNTEKKDLNKELVNLEIYKKYIKKIKLQKEFEEITEYFKKKEELKNREKSINESLIYNDEILDYRFVNDLREENSIYLNLLNLRNVELENFKNKSEQIEKIKEPLKKYDYIDTLDDDVLSKLERLKIKREVLKEKVDIDESICNEIEFLKAREEQSKRIIGDAYKIKEYREDIESLVSKYEQKLKELKVLIENGQEQKKLNNKYAYILLGLLAIILFLGGVFVKNKVVSSIFFIISLISLFAIGLFNYINKDEKVYSREINFTKDYIKKLEKELDLYVDKMNVNDYAELFKKIKLYDDYIKFEEKINTKINEKISQRKLLDIDRGLIEYEEINNEIDRYLAISKIDNLDELISTVSKYKEASKSFITLEIELENLKNNLSKLEEELKNREGKLKNKIKYSGFENIDMLKIEELLQEIEEKLRNRDDVIKSLAAVDETYSTLTKGKDMKLIKEELKDVINISFNYSYKTEEEIDDVVKNKNLRLVEVEKKIKDIENEIKNRFNGKRTIPDIEEEIKEVENNIKSAEKQLKATEIASEILNKAYDEIREDFGPILNKNVINYFKAFTDGKYDKVMVSDKYEMRVHDGNNIIKDAILSNGANDQLYLSLRLAFIEMIFNNKNIPICLDDAFIQYDDKRMENAIKYLFNEKFAQYIIFTCQNREENILRINNISYKYIKLGK